MAAIVVVVATLVLIDVVIKLLPLIVAGLVARHLWKRRYRSFGLPPGPAALPDRPVLPPVSLTGMPKSPTGLYPTIALPHNRIRGAAGMESGSWNGGRHG